jgi:hypothetical protein
MTTIAHALPEILQLVDHALTHSKQLQVNADGGVQIASFGTKVLRALNGIGQSDDWKLQQQHKVATAVRTAIEGSLSHAGTEPVANKYDRLFNKVREINLTAQPGELPVQRYVEALRGFDRADTLSLNESTLPTGVTDEVVALARPQDYRPLQDVRASLAATRVVEHELRQLDPQLAATLGNWLDSYRQEAQALNVAVDPAQRAAQGAQLLARLTVLANSVDQAVRQTPISAEASAALDHLGERISGEIHLIGAVIANTSKVAGTTEVTWRQAVELRRLGIDLQQGMLFDGQLQTHGVKHLAGGAMNQVYAVKDQQGREFVYKPGKAHVDHSEAMVLELARQKGAELLAPNQVNDRSQSANDPTKTAMSDMRYEARNIAASRLDGLLGTHVIVGSQLALLPKEFLPLKPRTAEEALTADETFANYGLLMDKVGGADAHRACQSANYAAVHRDPALLRDLSNLQLLDCILCSLDRHAGNFMIDISPDGHYQGLKGIDNDFSLHDAEFDLKTFEEMTDADKDLMNGGAFNKIKNKDVDAYRFSNGTKQCDEILNRQLTDLGQDLTDDMKARILDVCTQYHKDYRANNLHMKQPGPDHLPFAIKLREDVRATGLPDAHPLAHFFDRCLTMQQESAAVVQQREAMYARLKAMSPGVPVMEQSLHNVGLPDVADRQTAELLLASDFEARMVASLHTLLTPSEVKAAVQRLHTVQAHLRDLESMGRLLDGNEWRMDHVDKQGHTVESLLSDARHNHIARLDWKYEEWQAKEVAKAARAANPPAAPAAPAAAV